MCWPISIKIFFPFGLETLNELDRVINYSHSHSLSLCFHSRATFVHRYCFTAAIRITQLPLSWASTAYPTATFSPWPYFTLWFSSAYLQAYSVHIAPLSSRRLTVRRISTVTRSSVRGTLASRTRRQPIQSIETFTVSWRTCCCRSISESKMSDSVERWDFGIWQYK